MDYYCSRKRSSERLEDQSGVDDRSTVDDSPGPHSWLSSENVLIALLSLVSVTGPSFGGDTVYVCGRPA